MSELSRANRVGIFLLSLGLLAAVTGRASFDLESMRDLIPAIEAAFASYSAGRSVVPPVGELLFDDPPGEVHIKVYELNPQGLSVGAQVEISVDSRDVVDRHPSNPAPTRGLDEPSIPANRPPFASSRAWRSR